MIVRIFQGPVSYNAFNLDSESRYRLASCMSGIAGSPTSITRKRGV